MKDEIREILRYLRIENGHCSSELSYEETHLLLDYITNLQEENERLEKEYKSKVDDIGKLISRIYKAIEYIKENVAVYAFNNKELPHWEFDDNNINDLLNILQNGDDKNDSDWFLHILREMIKGSTTLSVLGKMSILREKDTLTDFNFKITIKKSVFEDILTDEEKSMLWLGSDEK